MSGDEHSSDESVIDRGEYEASRQDSANERAVICASVEDLKAEMGVRFTEVLAAVRDRGGGAAAGGAAGAAPAPGYGGARAAAGGASAPTYGGANAGYGLHRVESSPGLLQGAGRYGSGGGLGFTPAISSPFGAGGLNVDSGGNGMGTGMSHAQRRMEKVISDQRVNAWSAVNSRMWWVVMGCFPPKLETPSLQGLMHDSFEVTDEVADMLLNFRGFDPAAFAPRGAGGERIPIATHLALMAGAFITIARRGIVDEPRLAAASRAQVDRVEASFQAAIADVERHTRENYAAIQVPHNRDIFLTFIVKDMDIYTREVQMFADEMQRRFVFPPGGRAARPGTRGRATSSRNTAGEKGGKRGGMTGGGAEDGGSKGSPSTVADTNAPAAAAPAKRAKVGTAGTKTRSSAKGGAGGGAEDSDEE
ncbi:unnamed protein product [Ectocarpus sp. CCAP 1310/34]|nr:unnamed protein product [Ectocarpus sp. CCAP 1310/34]